MQTWQFLYFLLISISNLKTGRFETRCFRMLEAFRMLFCVSADSDWSARVRFLQGRGQTRLPGNVILPCTHSTKGSFLPQPSFSLFLASSIAPPPLSSLPFRVIINPLLLTHFSFIFLILSTSLSPS